ncbi:hypothetical protein NDU88_007056 [Pleurodeles waltl]|uniref:Uncharacterized protein n=1 Tax=Pleurodeles waltl TaxID=8319 RepID=A0AAV7LTQ6_PLEWA|nr:hypothetical protein NDU88_007056 [Pleurodeles waltl]
MLAAMPCKPWTSAYVVELLDKRQERQSDSNRLLQTMTSFYSKLYEATTVSGGEELVTYLDLIQLLCPPHPPFSKSSLWGSPARPLLREAAVPKTRLSEECLEESNPAYLTPLLWTAFGGKEHPRGIPAATALATPARGGSSLPPGQLMPSAGSSLGIGVHTEEAIHWRGAGGVPSPTLPTPSAWPGERRKRLRDFAAGSARVI